MEQLVSTLLPLLELHGFTVSGISALLDNAPSLSGHSMNVCLFGLLLAHRHEYQRMNELGCALLYHDVGKLKLPETLLTKTDKLR